MFVDCGDGHALEGLVEGVMLVVSEKEVTTGSGSGSCKTGSAKTGSGIEAIVVGDLENFSTIIEMLGCQMPRTVATPWVISRVAP